MNRIDYYYDVIKMLWPAMATALAVVLSGSLMGTFVQLRREGMAALALPQVVAIGAAIALRWNFPIFLPPTITAALAVVLLAWSKRHSANHWMLPCLFVAGLSISFLVIANAGAHLEEMQKLFTGMDVAVSETRAMTAIPVTLATGILCAVLWRRWLLMAQAPAVAELAGLHPARWDVLFMTLLAVLLLFATSTLGEVMVLAALFLPAATVLPWAKRIPTALIAAPIVAVVALVVGFIFSIEMEWPLSQSVGAAGFTGLVISYALRAMI